MKPDSRFLRSSSQGGHCRPSWKTGIAIWTRVKMMDIGVAMTSFAMFPDLPFFAPAAILTMPQDTKIKMTSAARTIGVEFPGHSSKDPQSAISLQ